MPSSHPWGLAWLPAISNIPNAAWLFVMLHAPVRPSGGVGPGVAAATPAPAPLAASTAAVTSRVVGALMCSSFPVGDTCAKRVRRGGRLANRTPGPSGCGVFLAGFGCGTLRRSCSSASRRAPSPRARTRSRMPPPRSGLSRGRSSSRSCCGARAATACSWPCPGRTGSTSRRSPRSSAGRSRWRPRRGFARRRASRSAASRRPGTPHRWRRSSTRTCSRYDEVWAAAGSPYEVFPLSPAQLVELTGGRVADVADR